MLTEKIIGKVYDGLIVTDEDLRIYQINSFADEKLNIGLEIIGKHINQVFDLEENLIQSLNDDPEFLINRIVQSEAIGIKNKYGKIANVYLIVTRIEVEKQIKFIFLYHHLNYNTMKKYHRNKLTHKLSVLEI